MKILILLLYYDRPEMVRGALRSVRKAGEQHADWLLAFIDDSSPHDGKSIAEEELGLGQAIFYNTNTSLETKRKDGSYLGRAMNEAIMDANAEIAIMLCDDDQLCPGYLAGLDCFFREHPEVDCCHSHVCEFNPLFEDTKHVNLDRGSSFNHFGLINPKQRVDASQVAWRTKMNRDRNIWFPWPQTKCLDNAFYSRINDAYPEGIPFSGLMGQYKGVHSAQLSHHSEHDIWTGRSVDITNGRKMCPLEDIHILVDHYIRRKNLTEARRICSIGLDLHPSDETLLAMDEFLYFGMR